MFRTIHNRRFHHIRGRPSLGLFVSVAVLIAALLLVLGAHSGGAPQANAADPNLEFNMEITSGSTGGICNTKLDPAPIAKGAVTCSVPLNGTFVAEVRLDDPGGASGQVWGWAALVNWTTGLTGPGDPSSTKAANIFCPGGISAGFLPLLPPQTAAVGCGTVSAPFSDQDLTSIRGTFEFNCGASDSQELVRMLVQPTVNLGTHIQTETAALADKDGTEVITILCGDQPAPPIPTPVPTATPVPVGGLAELPDVAGAVLQNDAGASGLLGGVLVAAAATVVALAGAGWYARRRWGG